MLYEFGRERREIGWDEIRKDRITAGVIALDALKAHNAEAFGFDPEYIEACERPDSLFRTAIEQTDQYLFSILSLREIRDVYASRDRVGLFVKRNLLLLVSVVDRDGSIEHAFCEAASRVNPETASLERIICAFFERLYCNDSGYLEEYENTVARMEEQVEKGRTGRNFNSEILSLRRKLLVIRNYYEQLIDIAEAMGENEYELFHKDKLHHFHNMQYRLTRLVTNTQQLRDGLIQVREAYQASLDYSANQIMKLFTVVTTVFLPLTLIVGWYGMNFKYMPELSWKLGYPAVIVVSAAIAFGCLWYFRKKKLL